MMRIALCLLLSSCQGLKVADSPTDPKNAHVYIINLHERKDRCTCMQDQLSGSPYELIRQSATHAAQINNPKSCPGAMGGPSPEMTPSQTAVFCSNQKIYHKVNKLNENEQPDYIITMEDDLNVHNKSIFWPEMYKFLNSGCSNGNWDILAVDTFGLNQEKGNFKVSTPRKSSIHECEEGFQVFGAPQSQAWGAHLLIIKKHAIPKLLKQPVRVLDHFGRFKEVGLKVHYWNPGLVGQLSQGPHQKRTASASCSNSVGRRDNANDLSQIAVNSVSGGGANKLFALKVKEFKKTHELKCQEDRVDLKNKKKRAFMDSEEEEDV